MTVRKLSPEDPQTAMPQLLLGWKNIAGYLGMSVRTVQRYERELGLPVQRTGGKNGASLVALKNELEAWVLGSTVHSRGRLQRDSQLVHDLRNQSAERNRLRLEISKLITALTTQCATVRSGVEQVVGVVTETYLSQKMEEHKAIATAQQERAKEMRETARDMCGRAMQMRTPQRKQLTGDC